MKAQVYHLFLLVIPFSIIGMEDPNKFQDIKDEFIALIVSRIKGSNISQELEAIKKQSLIKENAIPLFALRNTTTRKSIEPVCVIKNPRTIALSYQGDQMAVANQSESKIISNGRELTMNYRPNITGISIEKNKFLFTQENGHGAVDIDNGNSACFQNFKRKVRASLMSPNGKWRLIEGFDEKQKYFVHLINNENEVTAEAGLQLLPSPINSFAAADKEMRFIVTTKSGALLIDAPTGNVSGGNGVEIDDEPQVFVNGDITQAGDYFLIACLKRILFYKYPATYLTDTIQSTLADALIHQARFCPSGKFVAAATEKGVCLWNWQEDQELVRQLWLTGDPTYCIAFNGNGDTLAVGIDDGACSISYRNIAEEMSIDEHKLLKELQKGPAEKVLAVEQWKNIFDTMKNLKLKDEIVRLFSIV